MSEKEIVEEVLKRIKLKTPEPEAKTEREKFTEDNFEVIV